MEESPKQNQDDKKSVKRLTSKSFVVWCFELMGTIMLMPIMVVILDFYWFATLFSNKLARIGLIRGIILVGANILVILFAITFFLLIYCTLNPVECLWEAAKDTIESKESGG